MHRRPYFGNSGNCKRRRDLAIRRKRLNPSIHPPWVNVRSSGLSASWLTSRKKKIGPQDDDLVRANAAVASRMT
jgi:hypothetical protein